MILEVKRTPEGNFLLSLSPPLFNFVENLPRALSQKISNCDENQALMDRLFPRAYLQDDLDREYRQLLGTDLLERKMECIEIFTNCLARVERLPSLCEVSILKQEFSACLAFLNDFRIILSVELNITDDDWQLDADSSEGPHQYEFGLLSVLTILQQRLLEADGLPSFDGESSE